MDNDLREDKISEAKEKFISMFRSIRHISEETKESILNFLEKTDFFTAPASTRYHYNQPEGLVKHSIHVAEVLMDLTEKNKLAWNEPDSPLVIGLLHDICKVLTYDVSYRNVIVSTDPKTGKNIWGKQEFYQYNDRKAMLGIHGDKSVTFLLMLRKNFKDFTPQEIACIRWHMGASQEGEVQGYSNASVLEPLVVWTNVADNIASLTEPISK